MSRFRSVLVPSFTVVLIWVFAINVSGEYSPSTPVYLHSDWRLESSCKLTAKAEAISGPGFDDSRWHPAIVPGTVVGSLVVDKTLPDPNYGKNLNSFPGAFTNNKIQAANLDMPAGSPFRCSHWFRTEFATPAAFANRIVWLNFLGINYRANIWLNGKQLADRNEVAGAYRAYEFRIGELLNKNGKNALAVEIFAPGWTGTPRLPTKTPACGAKSSSPPPAMLRCAIRLPSQSSTPPINPPPSHFPRNSAIPPSIQ
jgi:hypothetical protein